jgi:hypothetical protein
MLWWLAALDYSIDEADPRSAVFSFPNFGKFSVSGNSQTRQVSEKLRNGD